MHWTKKKPKRIGYWEYKRNGEESQIVEIFIEPFGALAFFNNEDCYREVSRVDGSWSDMPVKTQGGKINDLEKMTVEELLSDYTKAITCWIIVNPKELKQQILSRFAEKEQEIAELKETIALMTG
ncbi:hypothetical protein LCGC14_1303660 [marine sediment metagenome]|uniref:Uncharacterized protein n=1 Tax=marine sediment metagenome TaxID=412755 RepID=A0A0F9NRV4_9ZZZZ